MFGPLEELLSSSQLCDGDERGGGDPTVILDNIDNHDKFGNWRCLLASGLLEDFAPGKWVGARVSRFVSWPMHITFPNRTRLAGDWAMTCSHWSPLNVSMFLFLSFTASRHGWQFRQQGKRLTD